MKKGILVRHMLGNMGLLLHTIILMEEELFAFVIATEGKGEKTVPSTPHLNMQGGTALYHDNQARSVFCLPHPTIFSSLSLVPTSVTHSLFLFIYIYIYIYIFLEFHPTEEAIFLVNPVTFEISNSTMTSLFSIIFAAALGELVRFLRRRGCFKCIEIINAHGKSRSLSPSLPLSLLLSPSLLPFFPTLSSLLLYMLSLSSLSFEPDLPNPLDPISNDSTSYLCEKPKLFDVQWFAINHRHRLEGGWWSI